MVTLSHHLGGLGGPAQGRGLGSTGLNFENEIDDVVTKQADERTQPKASVSISGGSPLHSLGTTLSSSSTTGVLSPVLAGLLAKNNSSSSTAASSNLGGGSGGGGGSGSTIDAEKLERREILKNLLGRKAIPIPSYLTSTGGNNTEGG